MKTLLRIIKPFHKALWLLWLISGLAACSSPAPEAGKGKQDNITGVPGNKSVTVEIKQMKFVPDVVHVKKGDTLVFINRDMVEHDVTEQTSKAWSSAPLKTDSSWTLIATDSQNYYCSLHEVMKGTIIVE